MRNKSYAGRSHKPRSGVKQHANVSIQQKGLVAHGMKSRRASVRDHADKRLSARNRSHGSMSTKHKNLEYSETNAKDDPFKLESEIKEMARPKATKAKKKISEALFPLACCDAYFHFFSN